MVMTNMQNSSKPLPQTLKPLVLFCLPEKPEAAVSAMELELPPLFSRPDYAVSLSAQQHGWLRKLAFAGRVFAAPDCESLTLKLNSYDLLIANPLSLNTLAKFALGLRDSFPAEILYRFAELGKPILLSESCLPDEKTSMNPHLVKIYRRHWQTVTSGTVSGFSPETITMTATRMIRAKAAAARQPISGGRVFITRDDIISASESLEPLRVPHNAIITDVAREEAEHRGVVIIQEP